MTELLPWLGPFGDPTQRIFGPFLLGSLLLAAILGRGALAELLALRTWRHPSSVLDVQLLLVKGLARAAGLLPAAGSAVAGTVVVVHGLQRAFGEPGWTLAPGAVTAAYTIVLFVAWDASRYALHRLLHGVPALWALHQVHHSAEVLTPLTFYRTHPVESFLYDLRGVLVTAVVAGAFVWAFGADVRPASLLGVHAVGFAFNLLGGNLRHSAVWLRYPARIEGWLISPAQHQLHHVGRAGRNYGAWLAIWDRLGGTLARAGEARDGAFGLPEGERNHAPDDLIGALLGPLRGLARRRARVGLVAGLLLVSAPAGARGGEVDREDEGEDAPEDGGEDDPGDEGADADEGGGGAAPEVSDTVQIVDRRRGLPRVAGSAHTVDEEDLERRENDDIHRVLAVVPGVYVRGEDGYGLRPNIGLRGANSDRSAKVTLLEDGVLLGPAPYSAPAAYYFPLATRMVGVEVFKGPAATRHGPQTIGGAINLQTRGIPDGPDGGVDAAIGRDVTRKLHGWAGASGARWGFLAEGVHLASDGFKTLGDGEPTGFEKNEIMVKARVNSPRSLPSRQALEIKLGYANERSWETYLGVTDADFAADPTRRYVSSSLGFMAWQRTQVEAAWSARFGDALDLRVVGYHHLLDRSWRKLNRFRSGPDPGDVLAHPDAGSASVYAGILRGEVDSLDPDQALMIGTNHRVFHSGGIQALAHWRASRGIVRSELEVGLRLHGDQIEREHTEDPYLMLEGRLVPEGRDTELVVSNRGRALALAVHAHEDFGVGPLRVLPGVRVEVVRTDFLDRSTGEEAEATRAVVLPGLGVHVQPTDWLSVLGGVHRGYSPVAPGQAPATLPETSWNVEAGARFGHRGFRAEAIGFFNEYENLTGQCTFSAGCTGADLDTQHNAGRVHVYGLEALVAQTIYLPRGLRLAGTLTYTWTGSQFATSFVSEHPQFGRVQEGDHLPYVPEHQGSARLAFLGPRGSVEAVVTGQGDMRDTAGQGPIADEDAIRGHVLLDLAGEVNVWGPVTLYATLSNVTNATYMVGRRPFGARPGRPFHAMVGIKVRGLPPLPRPAAG